MTTITRNLMGKHPTRTLATAGITAVALGLGLAPAATATGTEPTLTEISAVQGTGESTPMDGAEVTVRGIVTAAYPTGGINGFYLQTPGTGGDELPEASEGIFIYAPGQTEKVSTGDYVQVTGEATEYHGLTQIRAARSTVAVLDEPAEAVKPLDIELPAGAAEREALESMLLAPSGNWTLADNYSVNQYGELTLASGTSEILPGEKALRQPSDVFAPGSSDALALEAENSRRSITLDDGATLNFMGATSSKNNPLPYLEAGTALRVGAPVNFQTGVILDYRYDQWRLQPLGQVSGTQRNNPISVGDTRSEQPEDVGGNVTVGTFNVLNYFTTTGDKLQGCNYYTDREGNPVTVRRGCDARGAANAENLERQEAKIVSALNAMDADVVMLQEVENSAHFGQPRDTALATLVDALNEKAGAARWAYVPSPEELPASEDVIRSAVIYRPSSVKPIDESIIDDHEAFSNARQPLAQAFQQVGGNAKTRFAVIANHFKSKGSAPSDPNDPNADRGDGAGAWNQARVEQASELVSFAQRVSKERNTDKVLLGGDFNSYGAEDPLRVLAQAGYSDITAASGKHSYLYGGRVGSLDHVFASPGAAEVVTGSDVWQINANEPVALEYSRFNYNATDLYVADMFRASDHNPAVVGLQLSKR
ncbi:ExeM/NucH family extracellular endonuclease [Glutamicibacter endophyticus]